MHFFGEGSSRGIIYILQAVLNRKRIYGVINYLKANSTEQTSVKGINTLIQIILGDFSPVALASKAKKSLSQYFNVT